MWIRVGPTVNMLVNLTLILHRSSMETVFNPLAVSDRPRVISVLRDDDIFWNIMDLLFIEWIDTNHRGFWCDRSKILEAYRNGELYIQVILETDQDCLEGWPGNVISRAWVGLGGIIVPSFCIYRNSTLDIIWTDRQWRRSGVAKHFVRQLGITAVSHALPDFVGFWQHLGVQVGVPNTEPIKPKAMKAEPMNIKLDPALSFNP